jgi:uncharacterized protein
MAEVKNVTVTGVLKIVIPDPAVKLTLTFETSEDGDTWDPERLEAALNERGVKEGITRESLAEFLNAAGRSKDGPFTRDILTGKPPQPAQGDSVTWEELPAVPAEFDEVRESIVSTQGAPELYQDVREKVEKQKEVIRKGKLPFGQDKTELVTVTETVTRKERVYVDPKVVQCGYVPAEHLLGTFVPRETGLPGRDIFGRAIPAKQLADPGFYLGANIQRQGDRLTSTEAGFLRVGKNWADIIPFEPHRWKVELSRDQATCYLELTPGHPKAKLPGADEILEAAKALPYPEESLVPPEDLEKLVRGQAETGEAARMPITLSRDASFDIHVDDDKLTAYLNVHKGKGRGRQLSLKEMGKAIKESGLVGLDFRKISTDMTAFYEGSDFDLTGYVLAEGTPPAPGPDRLAEFAPTFHDEKKTAAAKERLQDATGFESFQDFPVSAITRTAPVEAEQLICTIDPPTPGEPGRDVYGKTLPAEEGARPDILLHENLVEKNNIIATTSAGVLDYGEIDGVIHLRVRPHVDAAVHVEISDDRMEGRLSLMEGVGTGLRLQREQVDQALEKAGVVHGIDDDRVAKAMEAAKAGVAVENVVVARGTPAVDQSENQLEFTVDTSGDPGVRIRKDGTADFKNRNTITSVKAGQELCRILPSRQEGVDGTDVTGKAIPARHESGLQLELGENVAKEAQEDGRIIITATTDGELLYEKNRIAVQTIHTIKGDVDMKVGNIKFPGTIIIGGNVRSGFYVVSGGDIKVAGSVEGALLSSDGDILIKQGVKGAGKAVLRSKRSIMSPFVELATLLSVGDITLKSSVVRSRIKCNGKITFQGDRGRIVGGQIRARNGLEVSSVGSPGGIKTHLSFGQDYLIADLIEKEEGEIEKVKRRITQVDQSMRKQERDGKDTEGLQKLRKEKVQLLKLIEKRGLRLFTLRERFEQHYPSRIVVKEEVHIGTVFESHGRVLEVTSTRKGVALEFNDQTGNIDMKELKNGSEQ